MDSRRSKTLIIHNNTIPNIQLAGAPAGERNSFGTATWCCLHPPKCWHRPVSISLGNGEDTARVRNNSSQRSPRSVQQIGKASSSAQSREIPRKPAAWNLICTLIFLTCTVYIYIIGEYWWMLVWDPESYHVRSRIGENLSTKKASGYALQHFYSPAKVDMLVAIQVTLVHLKGNVPHGKIMFTTSKPPTLREVNILVLKAMIRHVTCEKELNRFHHLYPTIQLLTKTSNITLIYLHHIQVEETHIEKTQVQDKPAKLLWLVSKYGTSWKLLMRFHLSPWTSSCTWETNSRTFCKEWAGQGKTTWFLAIQIQSNRPLDDF